jgi:hypothetical protein
VRDLAVPVSGEAPRKIRTGGGVTVDAATQTLVIQVVEPPNTRLIRVPLSGGEEREIAGPFHLGLGIDSDGIRNGMLLAPLPSPYWWDPPGILDLASGKSTLVNALLPWKTVPLCNINGGVLSLRLRAARFFFVQACQISFNTLAQFPPRTRRT